MQVDKNQPTINIPALIANLRETGRTELIHYAGAAHRDQVAWEVCAGYLETPATPERDLKSRALKKVYGWDVTPEQIDDARASYDPEARARVAARRQAVAP